MHIYPFFFLESTYNEQIPTCFQKLRSLPAFRKMC
ncbi:hypothetical protein NC651_040552 [Populus alba x Populus x berolinensis]|nr:hypothetical protein NC651_040552 [Populus alba x Populus x berolinensis]